MWPVSAHFSDRHPLAVPSELLGLPLDACPASRRVVLVAVGDLDRRAVLGARSARLIPAGHRRALHVVVDAAAARRVGLDWMTAQPSGMALDIVDDMGGIAGTIAGVARRSIEAGAVDEVVVLVGQLSRRCALRRLLHDGTGGAICRAVNDVPGSVGVLVPVPLGP